MAANDVPCCEPMFWTYLAISIALVAFSGLMSGLTLGLMSLSLVDLEVLIKSGLPEERKNAEKILPIVKNQHLLLCTLLIGNALAMEALPIFVDALLPAWGAILVSVTLILAFGEIIPQAICTRYGLRVGAKLSVVVRIIVIVLFPLAYPISKLLDSILGKKHLVLMRRAELRTLVGMHGNEAGKGGELSHDETTIITGALDMTQKTAKDAMTPISMIFSLDINDKLDEETMELLISKGHSRVPIYSGNPTNIIGLILVKNLIKCHGEDETPIRDLTIRTIPRVHEHLPLYDILNQFQKGNSHMAVVVKSKEEDAKVAPRNLKSKHGVLIIGLNPNAQAAGISHQFGQNEQVSITINSPSVYSTDTETRSPVEQKSRNVRIQEDEYRSSDPSQEDSYTLPLADEEVVGIITLEDVIEELLQEEILDETDEYVDVHNRIKVNMLPPRRSTPVRAAGNSGWSKSPFASPASSYHHHSPLSSYGHTPILQSPIPPYAHSPLVRPTLTSSPRNSNPSSPSATTAAGIRTSPSSHRVSRKAYEKLRKPNGL